MTFNALLRIFKLMIDFFNLKLKSSCWSLHAFQLLLLFYDFNRGLINLVLNFNHFLNFKFFRIIWDILLFIRKNIYNLIIFLKSLFIDFMKLFKLFLLLSFKRSFTVELNRILYFLSMSFHILWKVFLWEFSFDFR